jgi:predicted AlkP superfamily phosphohydrolase/phosphomutase
LSAKILVLGIDALDPDFFERHRAVLPNLSSLATRGGSGRLRSTIPPVTGPAWVAAFSGMNPAKTGITSFTSSDPGAEAKVLDSRDVKVPRVWNVLSAQDRRCAVVGVPLAYPVEEINGLMVGGFMTPSTEVPFIFPRELQAELVAQGYLPSMGLKGDTRDKRAFLDKLFASARIKYDCTLDWLTSDAWDCFITVLSEPDWIQHYLARPEGHPEKETNDDEVVRLFKLVDEYVGRWVAAAGPGAWVLVCSDHGFGHFVHHNVHVNRFLVDEGYLRLKRDTPFSLRSLVAIRFRDISRLPGWRFIRSALPSRVKHAGRALSGYIRQDVDWERSLALFRHQSWFMGTVKLCRSSFAGEDKFQSARQALCEQLQDLTDPRRGKRVFRQVFLREDIFHGPYADREPDIICLFAEGYGGADPIARQLVVDIPLTGVPGGMHRQDGVWMLAGPDVLPGVRVRLQLQDVAPIVYHLSAATVPNGMDGQVPYELFSEDSFLGRWRCPTGDFDQLEPSFVLPPEEDPMLTQSVVDRLRGLGYLE